MRKNIMKHLITLLVILTSSIAFGDEFKIDIFNKNLVLIDDCRLIANHIDDKTISIVCESPNVLPVVYIYISSAEKCTIDKFDTYLAKADYYAHHIVTNETKGNIWYLEYNSKNPSKNQTNTTRQINDGKTCFKAQSFSKKYLDMFTNIIWL